VLSLMLTLVPQALAVTIPMALLVGLLVGLGRLSSDREWVALQACGVGIARVLRPVVALGVIGTAVTMYVYIWAVPDANQAAREIRYNVVAQLVEGEVKPRVFFDHFPNRVLFVRDVPAGGGLWRDVFLADSTDPHNPVVYLADRGHMVLDRQRRTVELVLEDGTQHTSKAHAPQDYSVARFEQLVLSLDPETVFPRSGPAKGDREMSIAELRALIATLKQQGISTHNPAMEIQKKFSIPAACLVFALLGAVFGLTNRRDAKFASFVKGILVIYVYYFILMNSQSAAKGAWVRPWLATWIPNILLGGLGIVLLLRHRVRDARWLAWAGRVRARLERSWPRLGAWRGAAGRSALRRAAAAGNRWSRAWQLRANVLDVYIGKMYLRVFGLTFVALVGIFQISTFIDLSDKLFKGTTTAGMLFTFMWYQTPQYVYWCIPLSVLIGGLVTVGILTRTSELVVMRACGISLYRSAAPLLAFAVVAGGVLFLFEENVLAYSNRRAEELRHVIRGGSPRTVDLLDRRWILGRTGEIYNYVFFDPRRTELTGFSVFRFAPRAGRLQSRAFYRTVTFEGKATGFEQTVVWQARDGWVREFDRQVAQRSYRPVERADLFVEPPQYFLTEQTPAERMTYAQLNRYIVELRASGINVTDYEVELHRKVSFPWVTLIMTLIAVPFAVTTGRRGAMYGIGLGIVLALVYWITMSVFGAIGAGGVIHPLLAAWAPNILFAAAAAYLLLTVRT
ncbi:MAG: lipopolysaccharide transporter permease, partial [Acidobacteria bacterium]|nr:lipopolysaccharide transporter permease [Acidobacteriota bacterium]